MTVRWTVIPACGRQAAERAEPLAFERNRMRSAESCGGLLEKRPCNATTPLPCSSTTALTISNRCSLPGSSG